MQLFDDLAVDIDITPRAAGASMVTWSLTGLTSGQGDGLFVNANRANDRWCAVADAIAHPVPVGMACAIELACTYLMSGATITTVAVNRSRLLVRTRTGEEIMIRTPPPGRLCRLTWIAGLYGWTCCGLSLGSWPGRVTGPRDAAE